MGAAPLNTSLITSDVFQKDRSPVVILCALCPSHTRRRSVSFRAEGLRRYKNLLLRPVCGVCATRQLVPSVVASRQKHTTRAIELLLFLTPGTDQSEQEQEGATLASDRTLKLAYLDEDDIF